MTKLFIPKITFDPKLERKQNIEIFLNKNHELPSTTTTKDINLEIGNVFYENSEAQYAFANIKKPIDATTLKEKWSFISFTELTPENCTEYEIIKQAIKKLGYTM